MNKFLTACFILCVFSCQIFNIKKTTAKNGSGQLIIYSDVDLEFANQKTSKIKTKIKISRDSISILGYHPLLGIELGRLLITDDRLEIKSSLTKNEKITYKTGGDKLNRLKKSLVSPKLKQDSSIYENNIIKLVFRDYLAMEGGFFPKKITCLYSPNQAGSKTKANISVEYKSIKKDL